MAASRNRTKASRARRGTGRPPAIRRPALGNDPFARGAAPRAAAPVPLRPPSPARDPAPVESPMPGPETTSERVAAFEERALAALDVLEGHLAELAGRAGLGVNRWELGEVLGGILPRLKAGLSSAVDLLRLVEPPGELDRFGMDPHFAERFAPLAELLYRTYWRTTVREAGRVPAAGAVIVVCNHAGLVPWDALVLREALLLDHPAHRELRPLLDDRECALPVFGALAIRLGAVRSSPEAAEAVLAGGQLVGVFPEGSTGARKPWRDRYRLQRFGRGGFVKLALRTGAPIVPCAIVGNEEASPGISRAGWLAERLGVPLIGKSATLRFSPAAILPLPSRWSLSFGAPIAMDGYRSKDADDPPTVNALTERVRSTLQGMLDEDLAARSSVFL
ncbi:MAG TPA: lysophospholipid acyltransferase family protein [Anaeromyxobacter sp.]|nr:lysophospholipid acyltransferase family protein [Anaeromyxobacter sp.]